MGTSSCCLPLHRKLGSVSNFVASPASKRAKTEVYVAKVEEDSQVAEHGPLPMSCLVQIMANTDRRGHARRRAREQAAKLAQGDAESKAKADQLYERLDLCDLAEKLGDDHWVNTVSRSSLDPKLHDLVGRNVELPQNVRVHSLLGGVVGCW